MEDLSSPGAHLGPRPSISTFVIVDTDCVTFLKACGAEHARQIHYAQQDILPKVPLLSITELPSWALGHINVPGRKTSIAETHLQVKGVVSGCGVLFRRPHNSPRQ